TWTAETDYVNMGPNTEYMEPPQVDAPYNDEFGWARGLSPLDTARPTPPQDSFHGDGNRWTEYYRLLDHDTAVRHSVETVEGVANEDLKSTSETSWGQRWALPPNATPPVETR